MDKLQDTLPQKLHTLCKALRNISEYDIPRPVAHHWHDNGQPSKHDKCIHNLFMWEECPSCMAQYADDVLQSLEEG